MAKRTIMLVCSAGMSTSLLVTKMEKAAKDKGLDAEIFAVSASEADTYFEAKNIDVLLLGPQVRFMQGQFKEKLEPKGIPLDVINMQDYGMMNGGNAKSDAMEAIQAAKQSDFVTADAKMKAAEESLVKAHHSQTGMLTQEAQGNHMEVTLLTVHSQDHLMTSIAFTDLAKELIELYKKIA